MPGATQQSFDGAAAAQIHGIWEFFSPLMPTPQAHCGVTPSSFAGSETLAVMVLKLVHDFPQSLAFLLPSGRSRLEVVTDSNSQNCFGWETNTGYSPPAVTTFPGTEITGV